MRNFVALLRGINVGGHNKIAMKDAKAVFESVGLQNVQTYGQSGNIIFQITDASLDLSQQIAEIKKAIGVSHGFEPNIFCLDEATFNDAIKEEGFPFPEGKDDPKTLHLFFLEEALESPDLQPLKDLAQNNERFELTETVFYLHAPEGIGRSKLAAKVERLLGVSVTARNWRTVSKIKAMLDATRSKA